MDMDDNTKDLDFGQANISISRYNGELERRDAEIAELELELKLTQSTGKRVGHCTALTKKNLPCGNRAKKGEDRCGEASHRR